MKITFSLKKRKHKSISLCTKKHEWPAPVWPTQDKSVKELLAELRASGYYEKFKNDSK